MFQPYAPYNASIYHVGYGYKFRDSDQDPPVLLADLYCSKYFNVILDRVSMNQSILRKYAFTGSNTPYAFIYFLLIKIISISEVNTVLC